MLPNIDSDLGRFPYINGDLFRDALLIPAFNSAMRRSLVESANFNWSGISPAIFGSLFQSVMKPSERREQGAHYTSEKNILKVIEPLFLGDMRAEFHRLKARKDSRRRQELAGFQSRLRNLTFFDPACGCGNFLIIAYREIRSLEIEVIRELRAYRDDDQTLDQDSMPADLRRAHYALDKCVDRLYRKAPFKFERERVEHLFALYEATAAPLEAVASRKASKRRKRHT